MSACTCPSGDGSLRWPCPEHPPTTQPADGPYGWVAWWLGGDGKRRPIFHAGPARPTFGAELDALVPVVAVYTNAPA